MSQPCKGIGYTIAQKASMFYDMIYLSSLSLHLLKRCLSALPPPHM